MAVAPAKRRSRTGLHLIAVLLLAAVAATAFLLQPRAAAPSVHGSWDRSPRAAARTPMPDPALHRTRDPRPVAAEAPVIGWYAQKLAGTCARPATDKDWAGVQATIRKEAECLDRMWAPVVKASGRTWTPPVLLFYSDKISKTPCGPTPDKEKSPAHYCPGNRTVYVSDAVTTAVTRYRMLGFEVIAHEYVHHVQQLMGVLAEARSQGNSDLVTRRIELQAHCMAYAAMLGMKGLEMTNRELEVLRQSWRYSGDPEGHGSPEAQSYWGERGVAATTLASCDTFTAPVDKVT